MRAYLLCLMLLGQTVAVAQVGDTVDVGRVSCSYFGEKLPERVTTFASDEEAEAVIKDIIRVSGLAPNFEIKAAGVPNAAAAIYGGRRFILYDQYFVRSLTQQTGTKWAAVSVMAHEIGHHLNGHTLSQIGSQPKFELEADYFSGFVLEKLGASLDEARRAMERFGNPTASPTHPAKHDRLAAITNGWTESCSTNPACRKTPRTTARTIPAHCLVDGNAGRVQLTVDVRNLDGKSHAYGEWVSRQEGEWQLTPTFGFEVPGSSGTKQGGASWRCSGSPAATEGNCRDTAGNYGKVELALSILNVDGSSHWSEGGGWRRLAENASAMTSPFLFITPESVGQKKLGARWRCIRY